MGLNLYSTHNKTNESTTNPWGNEVVAISDLIRVVVLYLFGGVYFDLDVMFLRNLAPLLNYEFAYRWSYSQNANSALCHFHKGSQVLETWIFKVGFAELRLRKSHFQCDSIAS